jgi:telomere length regulation protein
MKMNDLLLEIRTSKSPSNKSASKVPVQTLVAPVADIESPDNVLDLLRADPDIHTLESCLEYLVVKQIDENSFDIRFPNPTGARIINVLVTSIIPSYWPDLGNDETSKRVKGLLINSLQSVPGIAAILARLRFFIATQGNSHELRKATRQEESYRTLIQILEEALQGDGILVKLSKDVLLNAPDAQRRPLWNELLTQLASSRIISTVAEAEHMVKKAGNNIHYSWLSRGAEYSRWLARNIVEIASWNESGKPQLWDATSQVLRRALSLGYSGMWSKSSKEIPND